MNALMNATTQTMSSREIADLTGKEHKHVKRDCEVMFSELGINGAGYAQNWTHPQNGQTYVEYALTYELVQTLITGYSIKLRHAVIKRLNELESAAPTIPQTLPEALRLAADLAEQKAKVEQQLAIAAPKADYYDAVVDRANLLNATQVAQKMRMSAMQMNKHLDALDVYNKSVKRSRVFQQWFIDKGYGVIRQTELGYPQAMFTLEGEAWIVRKLVSEGVAA